MRNVLSLFMYHPAELFDDSKVMKSSEDNNY